MSIVIDPNFSVYHLVERSRQASITLTTRHIMLQISKKVEKRILQENIHEGTLFSGFQRMSFFEKRRTVYERLARQLNHIYVFAYPDIPAPSIENITFVPLKLSERLSNEWFIIFHGKRYFTALVGEECTHHEDSPREFNALWTFDLDIIQIMDEWLMSAIDGEGSRIEGYDHDAQMRIMDANMDDLLNLPDDEPLNKKTIQAMLNRS